MKQLQITISVTNNGYFVNPRPNDPYFSGGDQIWSFESMKKLQDRLPEILEVPFEKREKKKT